LKGLSALMEARGITAKELAKIMGVHRDTISLWRNNPQEIGRNSKEKLCEYFRCRVGDLEKFSLEE